jgi:hypothetical protein
MQLFYDGRDDAVHEARGIAFCIGWIISLIAAYVAQGSLVSPFICSLPVPSYHRRRPGCGCRAGLGLRTTPPLLPAGGQVLGTRVPDGALEQAPDESVNRYVESRMRRYGISACRWLICRLDNSAG